VGGQGYEFEVLTAGVIVSEIEDYTDHAIVYGGRKRTSGGSWIGFVIAWD
jgi:hypothetical protein